MCRIFAFSPSHKLSKLSQQTTPVITKNVCKYKIQRTFRTSMRFKQIKTVLGRYLKKLGQRFQSASPILLPVPLDKGNADSGNEIECFSSTHACAWRWHSPFKDFELTYCVVLHLMNYLYCNYIGSTLPDVEQLVDALKTGTVDSVLVDMYTPLKRNDLFNGSWFEVAKLLETEISHGVLLQGDAVKMADELLKIIVTKNVQTEYLQDRKEKQRNEVSTNHSSKSCLPLITSAWTPLDSSLIMVLPFLIFHQAINFNFQVREN